MSGSGPAYGVFKLAHMDHAHDEAPWSDIFVGTFGHWYQSWLEEAPGAARS